MGILDELSLEEEELRALEAILSPLSQRAKHPLSLNGLLQRWRSFVVQVEQGYEDSIYEYMNDLSVRDILEEIVLKAPYTLRCKLVELLRAWDERFYDMTREINKPLAQKSLPWWSRVPKNLSDELGSDLKSGGFLK
jgi:hypothetical protein